MKVAVLQIVVLLLFIVVGRSKIFQYNDEWQVYWMDIFGNIWKAGLIEN